MQLMTGVVPSLQALQREGEYGRTKINQYTRYLSVPMALLQAYGFLALLSANNVLTTPFDLGSWETLTQIVVADRGLGDPDVAGRADHREGDRQRHQLHHLRGHRQPRPGRAHRLRSTTPTCAKFVLFAILGIAAVAVIIYIQEGQRRIPIQYASRVRGRRMYQGGQTFLPLRVNQAGVIPIIFAVSILLFPSQIASYFVNSGEPRRGHREGHRHLAQPRLLAVRRAVLPPDRRLHVLLHGVHVQAGRDRRAAAQERRVHPGHPPRPTHPGLPRQGGHADHRRGRPVPGHRRRAASVHRPREPVVPEPRAGRHRHPDRGRPWSSRR